MIFQSVLGAGFTLGTYLLCIGCALVCGVIAAFGATFRTRSSKSFFVSLILLPTIVSTVITMVNGSIGTGIAVAGAFSLVRFRSATGRAREIVAIFLSMTAGLTCSAGYVGIAILFTLLVSVLLAALSFVPFKAEKEMILQIMIPESLNFAELFEDLLKTYTKSHTLSKVKTANMGSMFKLTYRVELKDKNQMKELMDEIRCRNGNLEVALTEATERDDDL